MPTTTVASKAISVLQASKKAPQLPREVMVEQCEKTIDNLRDILACWTGRKLSAEAVAIALCRAAGCGHSAAAVARKISPSMERSGGFLDQLADRILARSHLWQPPIEDGEQSASLFSEPAEPKPASKRHKPSSSTVTKPAKPTEATKPSKSARHSRAAPPATPAPPRRNTTSAQNCRDCNQPPPSSSWWTSFTAADLGSCPTCQTCRMPRIPMTFDEMVAMIMDEHGGLPDHFDDGRIAPRPHEHAVWSTNDTTRAMRDLLLAGQKSLPFEQIVALADSLEAAEMRQPLQVRCLSCGHERNFDHLFGSFERITCNKCVTKCHCTREAKYAHAGSIAAFGAKVVPQAKEALLKRQSTCKAINWPECCNCETERIFETRRASRRLAAAETSKKMGLGEAFLDSSWPLGCPLVVRESELPDIPQKADETCRATAPGNDAVCGVLLICREAFASTLVPRSEFAALLGEPCVKSLFAPATDFGGEGYTSGAAGGADVNTALLLIVPRKVISDLKSIVNHEQRTNRLRAVLLDEAQQCEAAAIAVLEANLPDTEEIDSEVDEFIKPLAGQLLRGHAGEPEGKCETARPGVPESWASIMRNPDVAGYARMHGVPGGKRHTDHLQFVTLPDAPNAQHLLMLYAAGPNGNPSPCIRDKAKDGSGTAKSKALLDQLRKERIAENARRAADGLLPLTCHVGADQPENVQKALAPSRMAYGQPRSMEVTAGRQFLDATHSQAMALQSKGGANARLHYVMAECGVWGMGVFAALGLAPAPTEDAKAWLVRRGDQLLGPSVALTAEYTWQVFAIHPSRELTITSLACVQGFYRNKYGALLHFDTNQFGETYALLRSEALASWARAAGLKIMPTRVPQLFVALHSTPNQTVWTAFLQRLLHAAEEQPVVPRPAGWAPSRGAGEVFALQARGTKGYQVWGTVCGGPSA